MVVSRANQKLFRGRRLVGTFWLGKSWFVGKPDKFLPVPTWTVTAFTRTYASGNRKLVGLLKYEPVLSYLFVSVSV